MVEKLLKLRQQFQVKTLQIEALVAKKHGMGNLDDLAPADYQRVQTITGNLLETWEEGEHEQASCTTTRLSTSSPKNATT